MIEKLEQSYGITLTDAERDLLLGTIQTPVEKQQAHILRAALDPLDCPACLQVTCQRAALGRPFEWNTRTPDDAYHCPNCKRELVWHLGLVAGRVWFTLAEPIPGP